MFSHHRIDVKKWSCECHHSRKKSSLQKDYVQRKTLLDIIEQHLEFPFCEDVSVK